MTTLREAAQQALETLEWHLERGAWGADIEGVAGNLRAALAEPQEPVAKCIDDICSEHLGRVEAFDHLPRGTLLYAAPPQRKPLSEDEKRALADKFLSCQPESYEVSGVFDLISAVERAHGIGGEE